jgi:hypothetical protein
VTLGTQLGEKNEIAGPGETKKEAPAEANAPENSGLYGLPEVPEASALRADHLPASQDTLLPETARSDRRTPGHGIGRLIHIIGDPDAAILSAQPFGFRRLTSEEQHGSQD